MTPEPTPRVSIASLAVIRRIDSGGAVRYLAQWNPKWEAFSSVGGHKREGESHRACLVREVAEELGVFPHPDDPDAAAAPPAPEGEVPRCVVGAWSLGSLEYEAFSQSAKEMTRYRIALLEVELSPQAVARVSADAANAWLSAQEIDAGKAAGDRAVSETMRRHLDWLRGRCSPLVPVCWLIGPENRLREAMSEELAGAGGESSFRAECDFVGGHLRRMFPRAQALVIRDRLEGFRRRKRPHKLLVEVVPAAEDDDRATPVAGVWCCREVYLVKVGDPETLEAEWRGWRSCKPPGNDSILSSLRAVRDGDTVVGLIYGDATNTLGGSAMSLERAVRDCCRHGTPSRKSLIFTLKRLFGRLNDRFYGHSFRPERREDHLGVGRPASCPIRLDGECNGDGGRSTQLRLRVGEAIRCMRDGDQGGTNAPPPTLSDRERRRLRRETLAELAVGERPNFLDPFDYLALVLENRTNRHLMPDLLVGASHGDLHGRNILVAKLEDEVGSVAVFDYGDMHLGNHIGWDFVKMETELKARVYADLFPAERKAFISAVHSFEMRLADRTEKIRHNLAKPQDDPEADPGLEDLARLLLEIRRLAGLGLGNGRDGPHPWPEEYYFLLMCYGSYAMRFPTYGTAEFLAAYVSAGTAACRLDFPKRVLFGGIVAAAAEAKRLVDFPPVGGESALCAAAENYPPFIEPEGRIGHHAGLNFLRVWATVDAAKHPDHLAAAVCLLGKLRVELPHALEVAEVLLLVLLRQGNVAAVEVELADLYRRHVELPFEIECRLGHVLRDQGVEVWAADQPRPAGRAADKLAESLRVYERAWLQSQNYYPGCNVAGLHLLLGQKEAAQKVAAKVLAAAREAPASDLWARIAQADMLYVLGQDAEAARLYKDAYPRCTPQNLESSLKQLNLLLRVEPDRRGDWNRERLIDLFGAEAVGKLCPLPPLAKKE